MARIAAQARAARSQGSEEAAGGWFSMFGAGRAEKPKLVRPRRPFDGGGYHYTHLAESVHI